MGKRVVIVFISSHLDEDSGRNNFFFKLKCWRKKVNSINNENIKKNLSKNIYKRERRR